MSTFIETAKPTMMATGGVTSPPEIIGFDPVTAAAQIASGAGASVGSWSGPSAPAVQRVKFTGVNGNVMVNNSPPSYGPGEIAGFPAAVAAALIGSGAAAAN
jgi:hypothetical protein